MTAAAPDGLFLSPDQQDLLIAALTSNATSAPMFGTPPLAHHIAAQKSANPNMYPHQGSPPQPTESLDGEFPQHTPLLSGMDYGDWEGEFDNDGNWDYDIGGDPMQSPSHSISNDGQTPNGDASQPHRTEHEKRKQPSQDEGDSPQESDPKRRDDKENKTAKKPGRKPLTSEPTSKRKAQNRAAQRAFRERKEKHLKDLEQKVTDLEKASESANHENSMLRAQVDRLQTELREYKRRLNVNELTRSSTLPTSGGFQFDFPPFGSGLFSTKENKEKLKLGSSQLMEKLDKQRSPSLSSSNGSMNGLSKSIPTPPSTVQANLSDLFSPSIIESVNKSASPDYIGLDNKSTGGRDTTSSPSASSVSHHGTGSSCGTSPEPMGNSPISIKPHDSLKSISEEGSSIGTPCGDGIVCKSGILDGETEVTFCEKLGMACGNPNNPIPKAPQFTTVSDSTASSLDWLQQQSNSNTFNPVLFTDYRDSVNDINSHMSMGFLDDAFPSINFDDIGSPLGEPACPPKKDLLAEIDALQNADDEDEVVPADDPKQMLSCNKIWDRISSHPRFVSGELDMDGLCSELRSKAKCSEVGVVVAENDVQEVLGKVGMSHKEVM